MLPDLEARVGRLEDEAAIQRLVMSYGPCADAGLVTDAGALWATDGSYDWDASGQPIRGAAGVTAMLSGERHQELISDGVAHFSGPLLIEVDGDGATALNYSMVMRREQDRYYLWRVSAVRWDLRREDGHWLVVTRTNRLLDPSGAGRDLLRGTLRDIRGTETR